MSDDDMILTVRGSSDDLLWLRERLHDMRRNYERQRKNPDNAVITERLTRVIAGLTIGTKPGAV